MQEIGVETILTGVRSPMLIKRECEKKGCFREQILKTPSETALFCLKSPWNILCSKSNKTKELRKNLFNTK